MAVFFNVTRHPGTHLAVLCNQLGKKCAIFYEANQCTLVTAWLLINVNGWVNCTSRWQCSIDEWHRRLDEASDHILSFLDGRDVPVTGTTTTYRTLRDTFDVVVNCGYFTRPLRTADRDDDTANTLTNGHELHGIYIYIISYHIADLKRQNRLKVGTDKPKLNSRCSQYQMMMPGKDFLKSHVLTWRRKVYSDWEVGYRR